MNSPDFNQLWNASDADAQAHFDRLHARLDATVKHQSRSVMDRILRNSFAELVVTALLCVGMIYLGRMEDIPMLALVTVSVLAVGFSVALFVRLRREVLSVNRQSVRESLELQVTIIQRFIQRLNRYMLVLMPLGYLAGVTLRLLKGNLPVLDWTAFWIDLGWVSLVGIPVMLLTIWLTRKYYIEALYGRHLNELKRLLADVVGSPEDASISPES